jgi:uncharacterized protein
LNAGDCSLKNSFLTAQPGNAGEKNRAARLLEKLSTVGFWKRQARTWHWMSGAICLIGMLAFAATGITLNHARQIEASPRVEAHEAVLSPASLDVIAPDIVFGESADLPVAVRRELRRVLGVDTGDAAAEWTDIDVYVSLPRPGGDAWLSIDRETGDVFYEVTSRGAVAYLNDLHKGRSTGPAWSLFLDVFASACMVFCLSGLWLLQIHSARRGSTWPLVVAGIGVPVILLLLFVHM